MLLKVLINLAVIKSTGPSGNVVNRGTGEDHIVPGAINSGIASVASPSPTKGGAASVRSDGSNNTNRSNNHLQAPLFLVLKDSQLKRLRGRCTDLVANAVSLELSKLAESFLQTLPMEIVREDGEEEEEEEDEELDDDLEELEEGNSATQVENENDEEDDDEQIEEEDENDEEVAAISGGKLIKENSCSADSGVSAASGISALSGMSDPNLVIDPITGRKTSPKKRLAHRFITSGSNNSTVPNSDGTGPESRSGSHQSVPPSHPSGPPGPSTGRLASSLAPPVLTPSPTDSNGGLSGLASSVCPPSINGVNPSPSPPLLFACQFQGCGRRFDSQEKLDDHFTRRHS